MCGNNTSFSSADALMRLPFDATSAPQPSTPCTAFTQPALVSPPWSKNGRPVRGSQSPHIWRGDPYLYVCGAQRSGTICDIATAIASPTSTPGWCVPLLTGLPGVGFTHVPSGTRRSTQSKNPSFFGIVGTTSDASWAIVYPRVLP